MPLTAGLVIFRLICAIVAYFVLGSYYNYSQYGASGLDMIPHRDLWRDVPYIVGDLFKSTVYSVLMLNDPFADFLYN